MRVTERGTEMVILPRSVILMRCLGIRPMLVRRVVHFGCRSVAIPGKAAEGACHFAVVECQ